VLAIETRGLTRLFDGKPAVQDLSLAVPAGAFYGFLGPNGAGKSTTMKMLTGLLAPTSGAARVLDMDLAAEPLAVKRLVGVVPDGLNLFERLTGAEQLRIHGQLYGVARAEAARRADELLGALELTADADRLVQDYSHGMKKKLALAAAVLANPDLLFLDEPFEGVDAVTSRIIRDILHGYVARGSTVFLTSHVLEVVEKLCTHVGIIVKGELVEQDSLEAIRRGGSLEDRFLEKAGADPDATQKLRWLEETAP